MSIQSTADLKTWVSNYSANKEMIFKSPQIYETPQSTHLSKFDRELAHSSSQGFLRRSIKDVQLTPIEQGTNETVS